MYCAQWVLIPGRIVLPNTRRHSARMLQSTTSSAATLSTAASFMPTSAASFGATVAATIATASYTATTLIFLRA